MSASSSSHSSSVAAPARRHSARILLFVRLQKLVKATYNTNELDDEVQWLITRMKRRIQATINRIMIQYAPYPNHQSDFFDPHDDNPEDLHALWNFARNQFNETLLMWLAKDPKYNKLTIGILKSHPSFNDQFEYTKEKKEFGCNTLVRAGKHGETAFLVAVAVKNDELALQMLHIAQDQHMNMMHLIDVVTDTGQYALSVAVRTQNDAMVRSLLGRNACCLPHGENPLLLAGFGSRNAHIMKQLLRDLAVGNAEMQSFKYSNEELLTLMYDGECQWNECGSTRKLNLWDLLWKWRQQSEDGHKLLEMALYLAFDRKLEQAPTLHHHTADNDQLQIMYHHLVYRCTGNNGVPVLLARNRKRGIWDDSQDPVPLPRNRNRGIWGDSHVRVRGRTPI